MTLVPAPPQMTAVLANFAVQKAREDVRQRGWRSGAALQPYYANGEVGIRSTMKHLLYQNSGIKSFLMYWVNGRTVPMGCKLGDGPHFRKGKEVGVPGYVDIPHKGRVFRQQKWKHPGLKPKRFIESAIAAAIRENRDYIRNEISAVLTGKGKDDVPWLT